MGVIEQTGDGKDEYFIHSPQSLAELSVTFQMLQIIYGLDAVHISGVPFFTKTISVKYVSGTSFHSLSFDFLTYPGRGPPRLIAIL